MKHAILILAHKNVPQLVHLIEYFTRDCYVFVHIDKKSEITRAEISSLEAMPQVSKVYRKYSVHWGGFSMLKCEMFLLQDVLKRCDADYFHLLSGQDYPIKPLSDFLNFFEKNKGKEYLSFVHIPNAFWQKNTYSRFQFFYPYDRIDRNQKGFERMKKLIEVQKRLGVKRRIPDYFDHIYGGSQWFSITSHAIDVLLNYHHKHKAFYRRLRYTFAPEETYITTILVNLIPQESLCNRNLRYIRWQKENDGYPANLGKEHFHLLVNRCDLFTRKMEYPYCKVLIEQIDKYLLENIHLKIAENGAWNYNGFLEYNFNNNLFDIIYNYCKCMNFSSIIDLGCGAGLYVAALRRMGLAATGCDANPHTDELSALVLPEGDDACQIADIAKNIEICDEYDLLICIDVLPYISQQRYLNVAQNIFGHRIKSIILGWNNSLDVNETLLWDVLNHHKSDYTINVSMSRYMQSKVDFSDNLLVYENIQFC